jgi:lysine 2,3-aminomutase
VCPTYCQGCTRARAVGAPTEKVAKNSAKPQLRRWQKMLDYIRSQPRLHDIVISGGDSYYLQPEHIEFIGNELIAMPNIRRFRFATKGLCVAPERIIDESDPWFPAIVRVNNAAKMAGKMVAVHTHFNHANEISWVTEQATKKFLDAGVLVRNQTVLFRNINDNLAAMTALIRRLADVNIIPVSQHAHKLWPEATGVWCLLTRYSPHSTTCTSATWLRASNIYGRLFRQSSTSRRRSAARLPDS